MVRGSKREYLPSTVDSNVTASIHNRFDIEVVDAKTGKVKQTAVGYNIICNSLWTRLLTPSSYFEYIHYGTGSGVPSASDTSLFSFLGCTYLNRNEDVITPDWKNGTISRRRKAVLTEAMHVGAVISEVGIGYSDAPSSLCTHALLKDMSGNPITITKSNTDIITIYATVFVHWSTTTSGVHVPAIYDMTKFMDYSFFSYLLGGNKMGAAFMTLTNGCYGGVKGSQKNPVRYEYEASEFYRFTDSPIPITTTYDATAKKIVLTATRIAAPDGNFGGAKGIILYNSVTSFYGIDFYLDSEGAWWPGSTITGESIGTGDGVTVDFSTSFPFPENAKIYVNGTLDTSCVVDKGLGSDKFCQHFCSISGDSTLDHIVYSNGPEATPKSQVFGDNKMIVNKNYRYWYNPNHNLGIKAFLNHKCTIDVSDDFITWVSVAVPGEAGVTTVSIPQELRKYRFWRAKGPAEDYYFYDLTKDDDYPMYNIHFSTPPASGAVITADYFTKVIAKDVNHVFDLTVTIQLGEYTA